MINKIVLDAGHGGYDSGVVYGDRLEKDDNLLLALKLGSKLKEKGFDVAYTRDSDRYLTHSTRVNIANNEGADLFISLHRTTTKRPNTYSGALAYINKENGLEEQVANNVLASINKAGMDDIGVQVRQKIMQLDNTNMPAVLFEIGFINTDVDNEFLDHNLDTIAELVSDGLINLNNMN